MTPTRTTWIRTTKPVSKAICTLSSTIFSSIYISFRFGWLVPNVSLIILIWCPLKCKYSLLENKENVQTPIAMDIDDIPIPDDNRPTKLNDIQLPNSKSDGYDGVDKPKTPPTPPLPAPISNNQATSIPTIVTTGPSVVVTEGILVSTPSVNSGGATNNKPKSVTKLPLPPGIDQTQLEAIVSPPTPNRSPSPLPAIKNVNARPKTPPRKNIKDLPMPPGMISLLFCKKKKTFFCFC